MNYWNYYSSLEIKKKFEKFPQLVWLLMMWLFGIMYQACFRSRLHMGMTFMNRESATGDYPSSSFGSSKSLWVKLWKLKIPPQGAIVGMEIMP